MSTQAQNHNPIPDTNAGPSTSLADWPEDFPPREFIDPRKDVLGQIELVGDAWDRWISSVSMAASQGLFDDVEVQGVSGELAQTLPDGGVFLYVVFPNDQIFGARLSPDEWTFAGTPAASNAGSSPAH